MATGQALLVGLKRVDPSAYDGWTGENGCWGCELDVDNVRRILEPNGFRITELKTRKATAENILQGIRRAAGDLLADDIFVFYFSGHGGQAPDEDGDEMDGRDETLVAYNREVVDDELNEIWPQFASGVRIVMLSDSCNSGTNYKMIRTICNASPFRLTMSRKARGSIRAQMIHFGGCRDGFSSAGYEGGGAFTKAMCDAWAGGAFRGSYPDLHAKILELIRGEPQKPQYNEYGPVQPAFREERPFTVDGVSGRPEDCVAEATVRFSKGRAVVELNTDFGLPRDTEIPLARQPGHITVTQQATGGGKNGHSII